MHEFQQRYRTKILTENRKSATDAMREDLKGICDFEVRLPQTKAPRNRREEQLRMAQNEGAEIAWLVMAATTHLTFGFGTHFCMGAPLARLEGQRCIGRLVERFSRIERAPGEPNWVDALAMRGVDRLPVILN